MHDIVCSQCGRTLRVQTEWIGKNIKCPECNAVQRVGPPPPEPPVEAEAVESFESSPRQAGEVNPYASPTTPPEQKPLNDAKWVYTPVEAEPILRGTWALFRGNLGTCLLVGLVFLAQVIVLLVLSGVTAPKTDDGRIILAALVISQLVSLLVGIFFQLGATIFALKLARGEKARVLDLFAGGPHFVRGTGATFFMMLVSMGILLLALLPAVLSFALFRQPAVVVLLVILFEIPAFGYVAVLNAGWLAVIPMLVDRNLSVMDSLRSSTKFVTGSRLSAALSMIVFSTLSLLFTLVTCGLGFTVFFPLIYIVPVVIYLLVTSQPIAGLQPANMQPNLPPKP